MGVVVPVVRRSHEHQTKGRLHAFLMPRIVFGIHKSLLDENPAETVTYKYQRLFRMPPFKYVDILTRRGAKILLT